MAGDEADRTAGRMCKALKRTEDEYMMVCAGDTKSAYATLDALPDGHRETCREWGLKKTKIVIGENYGRVIGS